jgi:hypothetical protein
MNIDEEMQKITTKLKQIVKYDTIGFIYDLKTLVGQLYNFHNELIPQEELNGNNTYFHPPKVPKVHQIAYFNLGHGYPKELYGGHWCYVVSDFKYKFLIIPTTSVKPNSSKLNPDFEIKIEAKNFKNDLETRMQVTDMRIVDLHRIHVKKELYDVTTDKKYVQNELKRILFNNIDTIKI